MAKKATKKTDLAAVGTPIGIPSAPKKAKPAPPKGVQWNNIDHQALGNRMAADWNARAERDPLHWTVNSVPENQWNTAEYLATGEATIRATLDNFLENLAVPAEGICVEIGCGAGRLTVQLAKRFDDVIGLDVSALMVDRAQQMVAEQGLDNVVLYVGDGVSLKPIEDSSVDFVYSAIVLQHIPNVTAQLAYVYETARVLKPGGLFMLSFYADYEEYKRLLPEWEKRRQANHPMGWSELGRLELPRFETSMSTPMPEAELYAAMQDAGLIKMVERGNNTITWWVGGHKQG